MIDEKEFLNEDEVDTIHEKKKRKINWGSIGLVFLSICLAVLTTVIICLPTIK